MKNTSYLAKGLTLIEVMVSVALVVILVAATTCTIINSQLLSSLARHKIQAAYAGQQILEQQRRLAFTSNCNDYCSGKCGIPFSASPVTCPVTLDAGGTYNTAADDFIGTAVINVTNIDGYREKVQVEIAWPDHLATGGQVTMKECYATTVANEPQLN